MPSKWQMDDPTLLPNSPSLRRSMSVWWKITSWGCWRRRSAWKAQRSSKTWPKASPRMLPTWKPSAPAMYVNIHLIYVSVETGECSFCGPSLTFPAQLNFLEKPWAERALQVPPCASQTEQWFQPPLSCNQLFPLQICISRGRRLS